MTGRRVTAICAFTAVGSVAAFAAAIYAVIDRKLP